MADGTDSSRRRLGGVDRKKSSQVYASDVADVLPVRLGWGNSRAKDWRSVPIQQIAPRSVARKEEIRHGECQLAKPVDRESVRN